MTADAFRALLKTAHLSQRNLADRLGLDKQTVHRWIAGELPVPQYAVAYLELWHEAISTAHKCVDLGVELGRRGVAARTDTSSDA